MKGKLPHISELQKMLKKPSKYRNKAQVVDGFYFPSIKEADYYRNLVMAQKSGEIIGFLRQVPLHLQSDITYRMDFLVFYADGTYEGIEVKGYETKVWKIKKKLIDRLYSWLKLRVI